MAETTVLAKDPLWWVVLNTELLSIFLVKRICRVELGVRRNVQSLSGAYEAVTEDAVSVVMEVS